MNNTKRVFTVVLAMFTFLGAVKPAFAASQYEVRNTENFTILDPAQITTDQTVVDIKNVTGYLLFDTAQAEDQYAEYQFAFAYTLSVTNNSANQLSRSAVADVVFMENGSPIPSTTRISASDIGIDTSGYGSVINIPAGTTTELLLIRSMRIPYGALENREFDGFSMTIVAYDADMTKHTLENVRLGLGGNNSSPAPAVQPSVPEIPSPVTVPIPTVQPSVPEMPPPVTAPVFPVQPTTPTAPVFPIFAAQPTIPAQSSMTVMPTPSKVFVNGVEMGFEAYGIADSNYFKLRDIAFALNGTAKQFNLSYDSATSAINIITGSPYIPAGGEMTAGDGQAKTATLTPSKIYLNGSELYLTVYSIGGNNFFKLADLMGVLNVGVTYNSTTESISIDTNTNFMGVGTAQ